MNINQLDFLSPISDQNTTPSGAMKQMYHSFHYSYQKKGTKGKKPKTYGYSYAWTNGKFKKRKLNDKEAKKIMDSLERKFEKYEKLFDKFHLF
jgi:hypothetical protein